MTTNPDPAQPQNTEAQQPTLPHPEAQREVVQQPAAQQSELTTQAPAPATSAPDFAPEATAAQAPASAPSQLTQPTVPLPDSADGAQHSSFAQRHLGQPTLAQQPAAQQLGAPQHTLPLQATQQVPQGARPQPPAATKSRAGVFFAGIAVGAVIAGIVGGGAGALVAANQKPATISQTQTNGRVTLNNMKSATNVSGVAAVATQSVVTLEVKGSQAAGSGSGVIYSKDGYIVTNAHVVTLEGQAGAHPEIRVWMSDGRILDGKLVGTDPFADLAVVKIDADNLTPIKLADSAAINVGDLAVAIGAPLNLSNTVTSGVVSALHRGISVGSPILPDQPNEQKDESEQTPGFPWYRFGNPNEGQNGQDGQEGQDQGRQPQAAASSVTLPVIQTDASINPGNSGGALLNAKAELIGVNVAIASNGKDSATAGSDGLGFAIPSNMVKRVADALIAGEHPSHGKLGIGVKDSSADTDADRNFAGGLISELVKGGPADQGGLKVGDVITAVDGVPADSGTAVSALVRMHAGGDEVTISYSRDGQPGEAKVTLGSLEW